ncbi:MAG: hypothetical protein FWG52_10140 [Proteobacteria bacterium]|nr:hypothetical protein [Pseudomonadota bacterium]
MTVGELIEKLSKFSAGVPVCVLGTDPELGNELMLDVEELDEASGNGTSVALIIAEEL